MVLYSEFYMTQSKYLYTILGQNCALLEYSKSEKGFSHKDGIQVKISNIFTNKPEYVQKSQITDLYKASNF